MFVCKGIQLKKSILQLKIDGKRNEFLQRDWILKRTHLFISFILTVVMSSVVKLFITQRKLYKTLGIDIYQSQIWRSMRSINGRSLLFLISALQFYISTTAFLVFEAQTADEYGMTFYISITIVSVAINAITIAWQMDKIFILMRNYEEFIDKS